MRNLFALTIAMIAILAAMFFYVFYTPSLAMKYVPQVVKKYLPDGELKSLHIGGQLLDYPETLRLRNITGELEWKSEVYQFSVRDFAILDFWNTMRDKKVARVAVVGLGINKKNLEAKDGTLNLTVGLGEDSFKDIEGTMKIAEVNANPYRANNIQSSIRWSKADLRLSDLKMEVYGGQAAGEIKITFPPKMSEVVYLEFKNLKSSHLQTFNKPVFSQLNGEFSGSLRLSRLDGNIQVLAILAEMAKGATLESGLANKILGYMTDEQTRYNLLTLMEDQSALTLDKAEFRILNETQNLASVTFTLENKKSDLRIHETVNIDSSRILQKIAWRN